MDLKQMMPTGQWPPTSTQIGTESVEQTAPGKRPLAKRTVRPVKSKLKTAAKQALGESDSSDDEDDPDMPHLNRSDDDTPNSSLVGANQNMPIL